MAPTAASQVTWTLRLKNGKSTTLLHVDPLQSFASIKTELLRALHQTHGQGRLSGGLQIPSDPADVLLAKPVDFQDPSKGWAQLGIEEDAEEEDEAQKGKKRKSRGSIREDCPTAAGLKEGAMLAYKFRTSQQDEAEDMDEGLGLEEEQDNWNVVIASYDDGVEGE